MGGLPLALQRQNRHTGAMPVRSRCGAKRAYLPALVDLLLLSVEPDALAEGHARLVLDGAELVAHLLDDLGGGLADGDHGERGEKEGEHGAREDAREDDRLADAVVALADLLLKGAEERERREHGGADGEALAGGGGGVAEGVERVGDGANLLIEVGELGEAAR
eukprot:1618528-Pleurochrysis_carterae.AAC.1